MRGPGRSEEWGTQDVASSLGGRTSASTPQVSKFKILFFFSPVTAKTDLSTRHAEPSVKAAHIISFRASCLQPALELSPSFNFKEAVSMKLHEAETSGRVADMCAGI